MSEAKGYVRVRDIPESYLAELNAGTRESRTLPEILAVNFVALFEPLLPDAGRALRDALAAPVPITQRLAHTGALIAATNDTRLLATLSAHTSDTVRGAAAYAVAQDQTQTLEHLVERMLPFADDAHFGVREWAWLALRPALHHDIAASLAALTPLTSSPSPRIRRFAVEALRPRGVWCKHLEALKREPALALGLLEPLRAEPDLYPQDSVANWLNDASKTQPAWVHALCMRWQKESANGHTARIVTRALRSSAGADAQGLRRSSTK